MIESASLPRLEKDPTAGLEARDVESAKAFLEALPHPVFLLSSEGRVGWSNDAARRCYGPRTCRCRDLFHGVCTRCPSAESCPKMMAEATGSPAQAIHSHRTGAGRSFFHITSLPLAGGGVVEIHVPLDDGLARDSLTGTYTRAFFEQLAERELALLERIRAPFGVLVIDVDGLKLINDKEGHEAGDLVLGAVGAALSASVRRADFVGRIGGDEFCVFLPTADLESTRVVARRLQRALRATQLEAPMRDTPVRVSIGAYVSCEAWKLRGAIARADDALYAAKRAGGDRIVDA
jgi:diguanylate cyclase (GGDEF)-like protein